MDVETLHRAQSLGNLPGEIRNKIYRELLRSENCLTERSNPAFEDSKHESEPWTELHTPHGTSSTIQCVSPWLARYEFQTAILNANRRTHKEAAAILHNDNIWVTVTVNDPLFPKNMKKAGFPVVCCSTIDCNGKVEPSLKVTLKFAYGTGGQNEQRTFLLSHDGLPGLVRAIWLTRGRRDLVVGLDMTPVAHPHHTAMMQDLLLAPFEQLKGIYRLVIKFATQQIRDELQRAAQLALLDMNWARRRMKLYREQGKRAYEAGNWKDAQHNYVAAIAFINDMVRVYEEDIERMELFQEFLLFTCHMMSNLAHMRINLGDFSSAVKHATYVITISPTPREVLAKAHFRRGLAYVRLQEDLKAANDFHTVIGFFPNDLAIHREMKAMATRWRKSNKESDEAVLMRIFNSVQQVRDEEAAAFQRQLAGKTVITVANGQVMGINQH